MVLHYHVYVTVVGSGTVTKNPDLFQYDPAEWVELTATPDPGQSFVEWSGDIGAYSPTDNPIQVNADGISVENIYVTATFTEPAPSPVEPDAPAGYMDFKSFSEIDPEGNLTVNRTKVSWVDASRTVAASVYKNLGKIGNFRQTLTVYLSEHDNDGAVGVWGISNGNFTLQTMINSADGISLFWSPSQHILILRDISGGISATSHVLDLNTIYYLEIIRKGGITTVHIYSDENRTTLVETVAVNGNSQAYTTLLSYHSYNNASYPAETSGYIEYLSGFITLTTATIQGYIFMRGKRF